MILMTKDGRRVAGFECEGKPLTLIVWKVRAVPPRRKPAKNSARGLALALSAGSGARGLHSCLMATSGAPG